MYLPFKQDFSHTLYHIFVGKVNGTETFRKFSQFSELSFGGLCTKDSDLGHRTIDNNEAIKLDRKCRRDYT